MPGKYKYNPLVKRGFEEAENPSSSSEFTGVVGVDYDTIYDAIADGKRNIYLLKDTVEDKSLSLISLGYTIRVIGIGKKRTIRLNAENDYTGWDNLYFSFFNIILDLYCGVAFPINSNLEFKGNCDINLYGNTVDSYSVIASGNRSKIIADTLNITANEIARFFGEAFVVAKNINIKGNNQVIKTTSGLGLSSYSFVDFLYISGFFNMDSVNLKDYYIINNSGVINRINAYTSEDYNIHNSGRINELNGVVNMKMTFNSEIYNCNEITNLYLYSSYPLKEFKISDCIIGNITYYAFWSGHYNPIKLFRNNWVKNGTLKVYANSGNIENCNLKDLILYTDGINITNCKLTGNININGRDRIILTNNRTLNPINFSNGTNIEESNNIYLQEIIPLPTPIP